MLTEIVLISLWGGLVALDTTAFLQVMTSRPIVACTVVGLILGNVPLGFTLGLLLELAYITELPVGAAKFDESNVGAVAAAAIAEFAVRRLPERVDAVIVVALVLAIPISRVGGMLVGWMRTVNTRNYTRLLEQRIIKPRDINGAQLAGISMAFLLGFFGVLISILLFVRVVPYLLSLLPQRYDKILQPAIGGLLAAECVFLAHMFWTQSRNRWLLLLGLTGGLALIYGRIV